MSTENGTVCTCDPQFTCGHCMENAKPWFFTTASGAAFYPPPVDLR